MKKKQSGATIIEFALSFLVFMMFLLGITDFARMLFTWNAASEAARMGARYAVVCDNTGNAAAVLARMQALLPQIATIDVQWEPEGCSSATCEGARVSITNLDYQWISPIPGMATALAPIQMPAFTTYLPREIMRQDPNSNERICA